MNANEQLGELLLKWEEQREAGEELPAEALCNGDERLAADLNRYLTAMKGTDWLLEDEGDDDPNTDVEMVEETINQSSLTVANFTRLRGIVFQVYVTKCADKHVYGRLLELGIDSIATDYPQVTLEATREFRQPSGQTKNIKPPKKTKASLAPFEILHANSV